MPIQKVTKLVNKASLRDFFALQTKMLSPVIQKGLLALCTEHYRALYRQLNPLIRKCRTCDRTLSDLTKSRKCPKPALIQGLLKQNTDFSGEISTEDHVCYACYRAHLIIIKHMHTTINSTDADLDLCSVIDRIKHEMCDTSDIQHWIKHFHMQPSYQLCMLVRLF